MKHHVGTILFSFITSILIAAFIFFAVRMWVDEYEAVQRRISQQANILEGISAKPVTITVDYDKQIAEGSPMVFGGSHTPPAEHTSVWDQFAEVGVTAIRKDLYVEFTLPRNITVADYKNNKNNVQDPKTWDQKTISSLRAAFKEAKSRNIKVIGIMAYAPRWLTYNGTAFGVPRDWEVFKDIVTKVYTLYRDDLDYLEVWNEPDHRIFLVTDKSNVSKPQAYSQIYLNTVNGVKEVDQEKNDGKVIPFIAPVESNPRVSNMLGSLLSDTNITQKPDILSFHTYDTFDQSLAKYRSLSDKPVFITEWNMDTRNAQAAEFKTGKRAMIFTASRLIDFFNSEIAGANYFAMLPLNTDNRGTDERSMGFYRWINNKPELLPQAKSWRLLSKAMGLGKGPSKIVQTSYEELSNGLGFVNVDTIKGSVAVNDTEEIQLIEFKLQNTGIEKRAQVDIYLISEDEEGKKPVDSRIVYLENDLFTVRYLAPKKSVVGIVFAEEKEWYDILDKVRL